MGFYKKKKPEAGPGFIKKIQDPNWDSARNPVIYNFIITKISSYIYIYNVINPKIYIPHPHFISAHNPPLSSLYSLVSLVTHKSQSHSLTHKSQSHSLSISPSANYPTFHRRSKPSPQSQAFATVPSSVNVIALPQATSPTSTSRDQAPLLTNLTSLDPPPPHKATTHSFFSPHCELKILHWKLFILFKESNLYFLV